MEPAMIEKIILVLFGGFLGAGLGYLGRYLIEKFIWRENYRSKFIDKLIEILPELHKEVQELFYATGGYIKLCEEGSPDWVDNTIEEAVKKHVKEHSLPKDIAGEMRNSIQRDVDTRMVEDSLEKVKKKKNECFDELYKLTIFLPKKIKEDVEEILTYSTDVFEGRERSIDKLHKLTNQYFTNLRNEVGVEYFIEDLQEVWKSLRPKF